MTGQPRSYRFLWIGAGIVLLIGTAIGASYVLNNGGIGSRSDSGASHLADPEAALSVYCLGYVENDPPVISLPVQPGRIDSVVEEGHKADKAGEVLLRLDNRQASFKFQQAQADLKAAQAQLTLAKLLPEQLTLKAQQQQAAIDAARAEKSVAEQTQQKAREGYEKKVVSLQDKIAADKTVDALTAKVQAEESKLKELHLTDGQAQIDLVQAAVDAKEAQLKEAQLGLDECKVLAPGPGTVLRVMVHKGEFYSPQMRIPAIQFVQKGEKFVAEVLQEWADKVEVGQKVEIVDDTYDGDKWTGTVKRVAGWQDQSRVKTLEPFVFNDVRTLECLISIDEKPEKPMRIDQRVRVKILTGK